MDVDGAQLNEKKARTVLPLFQRFETTEPKNLHNWNSSWLQVSCKRTQRNPSRLPESS